MSRRARKKQQAEHENSERWLITYSDLITLLLIFFIIMYAMSKVDMQKYSVLAQSLQFQFKQSDTMMPHGGGSGVVGVIDPKTSTADDEMRQADDKKYEELLQEQEEHDKKEKELNDLLQAIQGYVDDNKLQAQITVENKPRGVSITLNDLFLFDLGKAELKPAAAPLLAKMEDLFPKLNTKISIEGHTDNLPITPGSPFRDNWGLSYERSLSVLRHFTKDVRLKPEMFVAVAYADTQPVAPNDSEANRQKNRRVEIVVLR